ncbi:hypothetical protein AVEN_118366-1 [Araneus ventricosus]|uniref:Uncharacterized protein n=1 Tax=Araneus ventricosus TaxID=182803 RepID=A0A4Y2B5Z8_ARAVE|nr:hypothetical protein AVEN_118366-1 [Araneus ventricosus]
MMENAEQIELLKKKLTTLRSSVTKLINKIEAELKKTEVTEENDIELYIETLNDKFESLKLTDSNLEKILSLKDIDKELESAEEYREKIVTCRFKAIKYIRSLNQNKNIREPSNPPTHSTHEYNMNQTPNVKLPKITIPKFSEIINEWLTFWNSYETSIHSIKFLDDISKFNYLKVHLSGTALETIEGFSISSGNYAKAVTLLEHRFGRKETLVNTHTNQLLKIPPLKHSNEVKSFRQLFDKI